MFKPSWSTRPAAIRDWASSPPPVRQIPFPGRFLRSRTNWTASPVNQLRARHIDGFQGARKDVGAHGWFALRAALGALGIFSGRGMLSEGDFVGLASRQNGVDVFPVVRHYLLHILAEVQPVEGAIDASQKSVQTDGSAIGDCSHGIAPFHCRACG